MNETKAQLLLQLLQALDDEKTERSIRDLLRLRALEAALEREQLRELTRANLY